MSRFSLRILQIILFILSTSSINCSFCQIKNDDYILWSSSRKLTIKDFLIKTTTSNTFQIFPQFTLSYDVGGFELFTKNFNQKVGTYFIKSASWIDTTYDVSQSLRYTQILFDISEIYARRFRKELRLNRKKFLSGSDFVHDINAKIMSDFAKRRLVCDAETNSGSDFLALKRWSIQVQIELDELKEFSRE